MKKRAGGRPAGWQSCDEARDLAMVLDGGFEPDSYEEPELGGIDYGPGISDEAARAAIEEQIADLVRERRPKWVRDLYDRLKWDSEHEMTIPMGHGWWYRWIADGYGLKVESVRRSLIAHCRADSELRQLWAGVAKPGGRPGTYK